MADLLLHTVSMAGLAASFDLVPLLQLGGRLLPTDETKVGEVIQEQHVTLSLSFNQLLGGSQKFGHGGSVNSLS